MNSNKISVIVPIYNSEEYLNQCIRSIVNQTYKNLEIILVNDGSTDNSLNICNEWKQKDNRIVVIDKPNGGVARARNLGLDKASGDFIGFVDHDDYIEKEMYETMMNNMIKHNADIVMCSSSGVYSDGTKTKSYTNYKSFEINKDELINRMLSYEKIFCSSVWSKLYKREVVSSIRFETDITLGDDYYYNGIAYTNIEKFYYDEKSLYNYRVREGTISRNIEYNHFFDKYIVVGRLSQYYSKNDIRESEAFNTFKFATSYEILYRLYEYKGNSIEKKKWKKTFKKHAKKYPKKGFKDSLKIFMMKYLTFLYTKITISIK